MPDSTGKSRNSANPVVGKSAKRSRQLRSANQSGLQFPPMNNVCGVSSIKRVCDFNCKRQYGVDFHRFPTDPMFQGHAFQILHDDERLIVLLSDLVDRAYVGMIQCRCSTGLTVESFQRLRVVARLRRDSKKY